MTVVIAGSHGINRNMSQLHNQWVNPDNLLCVRGTEGTLSQLCKLLSTLIGTCLFGSIYNISVIITMVFFIKILYFDNLRRTIKIYFLIHCLNLI